jgi:hypothetical protein
MGYFELAVALTRAEAEPTLARVASKYVAIQKIAAFDDEIDYEGRRLNYEAQVEQETWRREFGRDEP